MTGYTKHTGRVTGSPQALLGYGQLDAQEHSPCIDSSGLEDQKAWLLTNPNWVRALEDLYSKKLLAFNSLFWNSGKLVRVETTRFQSRRLCLTQDRFPKILDETGLTPILWLWIANVLPQADRQLEVSIRDWWAFFGQGAHVFLSATFPGNLWSKDELPSPFYSTP